MRFPEFISATSCARGSTRPNGVRSAIRFLFMVAAVSMTLAPHAALSQTLREEMWVTNGPVSAVAASGGLVYLGGQFTQVGPATGSAVRIDAATGVASTPFPKVIGQVLAVAPDGVGGWYIGGSFLSVRGVQRLNLARINAAGNVMAWNPSPNGTVSALLVSGANVYVGGSFTSIGGENRKGIAAINEILGTATSWNPNAIDSLSPNVYALARSGGIVYAAGRFDSIGGQARSGIAALDVATGAATAWNPNATGTAPAVYALALKAGTIYAGGSFDSIGGQPRKHIAAIDSATGNATTWNPTVVGEVDPFYNPAVRALAVSGSTVYAAGKFITIGGRARRHIAALDSTGTATSWAPNANDQVRALALSNGTVFAAGDFTIVGGQVRNHIAAIGAATGIATSWDPNASKTVHALALGGTTVFAGGDFTSVNGQVRNNLAALDAASGAATSWNPNANGPILALALRNGSTVYAGGGFTTIGGVPRQFIGEIDAATGAPTGWSPYADDQVLSLAVSGSTVYVGGEFNIIGGQKRSQIAALDAATGAATAWNPGADDFVHALVVSGNLVYAGGWFDNIGGQSRIHIAALDAATGAATAWNPTAGGPVFALAVSGGTVYAGGGFSLIGGQPRTGIAALDSTGTATPWNAGSNGGTQALAVSGDKVYVGGLFSTIGGQLRTNLAALDVASASATTWIPEALYGEVRAVAVSAGTLYAGGAFLAVGQVPQAYFAGITAGTVGVDEPPSAGLSSFLAAPNPFRSGVTLRFTLPRAQQTEVAVYDLAGRKVRRLHQGVLPAGQQSFIWDGRSDEGHEVKAGLYLVSVRGGQLSMTTRVARLR